MGKGNAGAAAAVVGCITTTLGISGGAVNFLSTKTKGAIQIGPLIQYTRTFINENNEVDMEIIMMLQCNNYIHGVE